ncbi:MAG: chemotaxis protein CheA [Pseudomonadota bacterium]
MNKSLEEISDGIALSALMSSSGDLAGLGNILSQTEEILACEDQPASPVAVSIAQGIKSLLERIILMDIEDTTEVRSKLNQGITILQEALRKGETGGANLISSFNSTFSGLIALETEGKNTDPQDIPGGKPVSPTGAIVRDLLNDPEQKECLDGFIIECLEYIQQIEVEIVSLEQSPGDKECINAIFRPFHTIKGLSNFLNLEEMNRLAHQTENILDKARNDELAITSDVIDLILSVVDVLKRMIGDLKRAVETGDLDLGGYDIDGHLERIRIIGEGEGVRETAGTEEQKPEIEEKVEVHECAEEEQTIPAEPAAAPASTFIDENQDQEVLASFVSESLEHLQQIEVDILALEHAPDDRECINAVFRPFHTIKGVSGFLNLFQIKKVAHETENVLDKARNGQIAITSEITDLILDGVDILKKMVLDIKQVIETGQVENKEYAIDDYIDRLKSVQADTQEEGGKKPVPKEGQKPKEEPRREPEKAPEKVPEPAPVAEKTGDLSPSAPPVTTKTETEPPPAAGANHPVAGSAPVDDRGRVPAASGNVMSAIKVDIGKLDNLVDTVGELVIIQSLIHQNSHILALKDQKLARDFSQLARITGEIQKTAMSLRMVPIKQTFQKMIRLVRDLAKKSGKSVDLQMSGEDTEIDRNMVDAIYDPLVHMIRNAVDHGMEMPQERRSKGKPDPGSVWLRAYQKGGNIIIEIEDDGQGLNREKILKKARDKGLIKENESLSTFEIDNMIFQAGFSTADKITDVSGRGVGMDVVKKAIEKLRGKVEINSAPGQGSTFTIKLPLTLAIIDGIVVKVGPERYIIPTTAIKETIRPKEGEYITVHGKGEMITVRGNLLPLVRLYKMFKVESDRTNPCEALVVVVENEGRQKCLLVDDLLGKQEAVIKSLGEHMKDVKGLAGGTILGDGKIGLILDVNGLFDIAEHKNVSGA